jgi:hypothetical protein
MLTQSYYIAQCSCKVPHKDGVFVVRLVHSNRREWACRLCPHYSTATAAREGANMKRHLRAFVIDDLANRGRSA